MCNYRDSEVKVILYLLDLCLLVILQLCLDRVKLVEQVEELFDEHNVRLGKRRLNQKARCLKWT